MDLVPKKLVKIQKKKRLPKYQIYLSDIPDFEDEVCALQITEGKYKDFVWKYGVGKFEPDGNTINFNYTLIEGFLAEKDRLEFENLLTDIMMDIIADYIKEEEEKKLAIKNENTKYYNGIIPLIRRNVMPTWLEGKKTYIVAAIAAAMAILSAFGVVVPEWVLQLLAALGLYTVRSAISTSAAATKAAIAPKVGQPE